MNRHLGVLGVGGVGGYFGAKLCRAKGEVQKIYFLARGAHLQAIQTNGLTVKTASEGELTCRPDGASDDKNDFPEFDFCLVTVKGYDLAETLSGIKEKISPHTVLLPLLNGIYIDDRVREIIPQARVLPGCAYISSHIEQPGLVVQTGGACSIVFGRDPRHPDFYPEEILSLFDAAGITYQFVEDPTPAIWEKYAFIAPFSLVTARFNKPIGEVIASPELSRYVEGIMREIISLATKKGIHLPENIMENIFEKARNFPPDTRTSFQNDYSSAGRRDERETFGGTLIQLCAEHGIPCETTRKIYQELNQINPV